MWMFNITTFIAVVIRILKIHTSLIFSMNCFSVETAFIMVCRQAAGRCSCCDFESLRHQLGDESSSMWESGQEEPFCFSSSVRFEHEREKHPGGDASMWQGLSPPVFWVFFRVPPWLWQGHHARCSEELAVSRVRDAGPVHGFPSDTCAESEGRNKKIKNWMSAVLGMCFISWSRTQALSLATREWLTLI